MSLNPMNRHLLVEEVRTKTKEEEANESLVLVPDDYKVSSQFGSYKVLKCAKDCEKIGEAFVGRKVVVENSMVQKVPLEGKTYYLVLENYVYGTY